jgi:hypothetical protein
LVKGSSPKVKIIPLLTWPPYSMTLLDLTLTGAVMASQSSVCGIAIIINNKEVAIQVY